MPAAAELPGYWFRLAIESGRQGHPSSEVLGYIERDLERYPDDIDAIFIKADLLNDLGRPDDAIATVESAIKMGFTTASVWAQQGYYLFESERYEEAIVAFDSALARDATLTLALRRRGESKLVLGRFDQALEDQYRYITAVPDDTVAWSNKIQKMKKK